MDYDSTVQKVAKIREELHQIGEKNREYFLRKHHRGDEPVKHHGRQERILQLKAELESMLKNKKSA